MSTVGDSASLVIPSSGVGALITGQSRRNGAGECAFGVSRQCYQV